MSKSKPITLEDAKKIDERMSKDKNVNSKVSLGSLLSKIGKSRVKKGKKKDSS
jgi:hypothetical protein